MTPSGLPDVAALIVVAFTEEEIAPLQEILNERLEAGEKATIQDVIRDATRCYPERGAREAAESAIA